MVSLPIGSVRLTERLLKHDPPTDDEKAELVATIDDALAQAPAPRGTVVGIAGTVTTLARDRRSVLQRMTPSEYTV